MLSGWKEGNQGEFEEANVARQVLFGRCRGKRVLCVNAVEEGTDAES